MTMTLADAIIYGALADVETVLAQGEEVNALDEYGFTPLIEAAIFDKVDVAELLLRRGAWVDSPDMTGRTALHWAVDNHNLSMAKLLLEYKANPNAYTKSCQPVMTYALLRGQEDIKEILYQYDVDLNFTQDYINTKLIGHRFELEGQVHIVDSDRQFIILDFEGFFLEFTLSVIADSLKRFKRNFAAKHLNDYFKMIREIIYALHFGNELIKYQHFTDRYKQFEKRIDSILNNDLLCFPLAYEGHAITCLKYGNLWIKVDRGWNSRIEGSVVIYKITKPKLVTKAFMKKLIYKKQSRAYVNEGINKEIGLIKIGELPLPVQLIGNCSWANVEGSVPAMLLLLLLSDESHLNKQTISKHKALVMEFFEEWREWDKDRSLEECIQSFKHADPARKASKAALLAAVLAQKCRYTNPRDLKRAEKILPILAIPEYQYNLESYIKVFIDREKTALGNNLMHLLDLAAPSGMRLSINHNHFLVRKADDI